MNTPDRIKFARLKLGLAPDAVARSVGIPIAHYYDLEGYEDELNSTITMADALKLAAILKSTLPVLLWGECGPPARPLADLADKVRSRLADVSRGQDDIPWVPEPLFTGVGSALNQPIDFLKDMSDWVGEDWRSYLVFLAETVPEN